MFKIGDLSKITNISVKTIRYYEEENLIHPIEVDRWTGYRYYDDSSIRKLSEIIYLKDLGFSLKEISSFSEDLIKEKTKELQEKITQLTKNIKILSTLKNEGGKYNMKTFINDPQVIGKWRKLGVVKEKNDFKTKKFDDDEIFDFKELYFLPNGEDYWVFCWTKGILYLKDMSLPYEIIEGKLFVGVLDFKTNTIDNYAIYEKVDNKEYRKEDIAIRDNTNIPFIEDANILGFWESVDFVRDFGEFKLNKKHWKNKLFLKSYTFNPNGVLLVEFNERDDIQKINWSKNVVINKNDSTASEYIIKKIDGEKIMFVEWKSGDYVYGGQIFGYYVLKQIK